MNNFIDRLVCGAENIDGGCDCAESRLPTSAGLTRSESLPNNNMVCRRSWSDTYTGSYTTTYTVGNTEIETLSTFSNNSYSAFKIFNNDFVLYRVWLRSGQRRVVMIIPSRVSDWTHWENWRQLPVKEFRSCLLLRPL